MTEPTSPLQIRDYRAFWMGRFFSVVAQNGMVVILGYQVYDVARDAYGMGMRDAAFQLGLLGLAQFLPLMLLTPLAGFVADRFDRRHVATLALSCDVVVAVSLAAVTAAGMRSLPLLFALAAMHGAIRVFVNPPLAALAANIVPAPLMPRAIALNSIAWQAGMVIGPAAFGFIYPVDHALPYWTAAVIFGFALAGIVSIRPLDTSARQPSGARPWRQIADGFSYVRSERFLLGCITLDLFAVILAGATALLPVFARDILHVGAEGLGQMRAAPAFGAAIVALWFSWRPLESNVGVKMLAAVAVFGAFTIAFAFSRSFVLSLAFLAILGAADMVSVFIRNSLILLNTPDAMRGRVSAISGLAVSASNELGEMQSGIAAALLGATGAVVFGGVGAIVVTLAWAVLFPEIRNARTFAPHYRQTE